VLGVNALFSTAYGNVGSSTYYALGLVASFALGLTPVVFVIAGVIFYLTAATYSEATAMFPEAGGSSSFARHAFNEFWSFFAAWGQMLNYVITVAISAFFVPHYIGGLFWAYLKTSPGDIIVGIAVIVVLCAINIVGVKEAAGVNVVLAFTDFSTQLALVILGCVLVLSPETLVNNVHLGTVPTWKNFIIAIPVAMIAYTGIETISNMAEEAKDEVHTIPKAIKGVVAAVFAIYALMPAVALSALPVTCNAAGKCQTLLGLPESQGGYAGDPVLGIVTPEPRPVPALGEITGLQYCATILFIATNAGIIGVSRPVYSMGLPAVPSSRELHPVPVDRNHRVWGIACLTLIRSGRLSGQHVRSGRCCRSRSPTSVIRLRIKYPDARGVLRPGAARGGYPLPVRRLGGSARALRG
jgi:APA family basic amino acid/polyamine antiporter